MHNNGTQTTCNGPNPIGHAHQNTGVFRGDIQMVNIKTRYCETAEGNAYRKCGHSLRYRVRIGHDEEEGGLHSESATIEQLPHLGRGQNTFLSQSVGQ